MRYRRVLFVCHANTSRSIIAEALLRRMLAADAATEGIRIRSGGIAAYARDGALASLDARLVLRDAGVDLSADASSTDLKRHPELVDEADLILAMTERQLEMLVDLYPDVEGKPLYTLRSFAGLRGDIEDPVGKSEEVFAACLSEIRECLERALPRFFREASDDAADVPKPPR